MQSRALWIAVTMRPRFSPVPRSPDKRIALRNGTVRVYPDHLAAMNGKILGAFPFATLSDSDKQLAVPGEHQPGTEDRLR